MFFQHYLYLPLNKKQSRIQRSIRPEKIFILLNNTFWYTTIFEKFLLVSIFFIHFFHLKNIQNKYRVTNSIIK